ncbi:phosphate acyltransferase PlsX [Thermosulfurimonas marina]|uniref:Phosphate acyltransferase n=1 Tax=Thermosulfurimonas marina TaxID=2047767 RepID=A0A6H1WUS1_9BACT|nr:phosphate acyltransferase PlsX [Thermosulfurimonas marina]
MRVALDVMGGDYAPREILSGARKALKENSDLFLLLVGPEEVLEKFPSHERVEKVPAPEWVEMEEAPAEALRKKPRASIRVALELIKEGQAQAVVSAGNSGATFGAALLTLGRLPGVLRPAIATVLPTLGRPAVLIDAGANVDCKPVHLFQFALMGALFSERILGIKRPRVGLLSIGEEGGKGNFLVKRAHALLSESPLNFVGNVEGRHIYSGEAEVIVCDGFVGNICLKVSEGVAEALGEMLKREVRRDPLALLGFSLARRALSRFRHKVDWREYGGAPLLGVNGVVIIGHGRSDARAIKNALFTASRFVKTGLVEKLRLSLSAERPDDLQVVS